jgi:hypothetical protein
VRRCSRAITVQSLTLGGKWTSSETSTSARSVKCGVHPDYVKERLTPSSTFSGVYPDNTLPVIDSISVLLPGTVDLLVVSQEMKPVGAPCRCYERIKILEQPSCAVRSSVSDAQAATHPASSALVDRIRVDIDLDRREVMVGASFRISE